MAFEGQSTDIAAPNITTPKVARRGNCNRNTIFVLNRKNTQALPVVRYSQKAQQIPLGDFMPDAMLKIQFQPNTNMSEGRLPQIGGQDNRWLATCRSV
jgi:hypothetical protein